MALLGFFIQRNFSAISTFSYHPMPQPGIKLMSAELHLIDGTKIQSTLPTELPQPQQNWINLLQPKECFSIRSRFGLNETLMSTEPFDVSWTGSEPKWFDETETRIEKDSFFTSIHSKTSPGWLFRQTLEASIEDSWIFITHWCHTSNLILHKAKRVLLLESINITHLWIPLNFANSFFWV